MPAESITLQPRSPWQTALTRLTPGLLLSISRGAGILAQMLVQVAVGALAGPAGLGMLQLFTSWSSIGGEIAARGHPTQLLRQASVAHARGDAAVIRRQSRWRLLDITLFALLPIACVVTLNALGFIPAQYRWLLPCVAVAAPLFALVRLFAETLKAIDQPLVAITLENLVIPTVLLALCAAVAALGTTLDNTLILAGGLISVAITALWLGLQLVSALGQSPVLASRESPDAPQDKPQSTEQRNERRTLWLSGILGMGFLHLPFLVLPVFADNAEIGVFSVAFKLLNVITTLLILLGAVYGPRFARLAAAADGRGLDACLRQTQWLSVALFLPAACLLLLGHHLLADVFSLPPDSLLPLLSVLCLGQLLNAATGLSGLLLNMTGHARWELRTLVVAGGATVLLSPIVGPQWGTLGLAWLFTGAIALKNLLSWLLARRALQAVVNA